MRLHTKKIYKSFTFPTNAKHRLSKSCIVLLNIEHWLIMKRKTQDSDAKDNFWFPII